MIKYITFKYEECSVSNMNMCCVQIRIIFKFKHEKCAVFKYEKCSTFKYEKCATFKYENVLFQILNMYFFQIQKMYVVLINIYLQNIDL